MSVSLAQELLQEAYPESGLKFTPDGKMVGDVAEAFSANLFDLKLVSRTGIDAYDRHETPVQIKATGRSDGSIQFRVLKERLPNNLQLLVFRLDWKLAEAELVFNGLESQIRNDKARAIGKQYSVKLSDIRAVDGHSPLPMNKGFKHGSLVESCFEGQ